MGCLCSVEPEREDTRHMEEYPEPIKEYDPNLLVRKPSIKMISKFDRIYHPVDDGSGMHDYGADGRSSPFSSVRMPDGSLMLDPGGGAGAGPYGGGAGPYSIGPGPYGGGGGQQGSMKYGSIKYGSMKFGSLKAGQGSLKAGSLKPARRGISFRGENVDLAVTALIMARGSGSGVLRPQDGGSTGGSAGGSASGGYESSPPSPRRRRSSLLMPGVAC